MVEMRGQIRREIGTVRDLISPEGIHEAAVEVEEEAASTVAAAEEAPVADSEAVGGPAADFSIKINRIKKMINHIFYILNLKITDYERIRSIFQSQNVHIQV